MEKRESKRNEGCLVEDMCCACYSKNNSRKNSLHREVFPLKWQSVSCIRVNAKGDKNEFLRNAESLLRWLIRRWLDVTKNGDFPFIIIGQLAPADSYLIHCLICVGCEDISLAHVCVCVCVGRAKMLNCISTARRKTEIINYYVYFYYDGIFALCAW